MATRCIISFQEGPWAIVEVSPVLFELRKMSLQPSMAPTAMPTIQGTMNKTDLLKFLNYTETPTALSVNRTLRGEYDN